MAERADITVNWGIFSRSSPRTVEVDSPSTALIVQDLLDTLRSNTLSAGEPDLQNLDDDALLNQEFDPAGKTPVQPALQTGITATLFNAKLRFAARAGPATVLCTVTRGNVVSYLRDEGTQTGGDSNTVLIDSAADFINFGIEVKDQDKFEVLNVTDGSSALVSTVDSGIQITTDGLTGGSDNLFQAGDEIIVQGYATSPILPSAFTTVSYAASEAPTIQSIDLMQDQIADVHGQVRRSIWVDTAAVTNGDGYQQTPYNNFTDAADDAEASNIQQFMVLADATLDRQLRNFIFIGIGSPVINFNGQDVNRSEFRSLELDGTMIAADGIRVTDCDFRTNFSGFNGKALSYGLQGVITLASGADVEMIDGHSSVGGLGRPTVNSGGGTSNIAIRGWRGGKNFGAAAAGDEITVSISEGKLTLLATNVGGTISVRGQAQYDDNSAGSTVDRTGLINTEEVRLSQELLEADQVFDQSAGLLHYYRKGTTVDLIPAKTVVTTQTVDTSLTE